MDVLILQEGPIKWVIFTYKWMIRIVQNLQLRSIFQKYGDFLKI
jgi:hypothetical protein